MIERRELLTAGAGLVVAATLAAPAAAQHHRMEGMVMSLAECVDECVASHRMCLETAAYVTRRGGALAIAPLIAMLTDCAELCQTTANSMLRESALHRIICGACAEACERCAQECLARGKDEQIERCSATCRRCAAGCRMMADTAS
ncbi:four-helix bundle copper-binding protein [Sphingomonas sp. AP4-R1]|uniref:four-helix bundle copper-binding protein n=1 Tax=Sphingomonas sp. AP4-R1 TaxID=2735134 RepID=UPI0014938FE5|nr:four-helix bundle copper-binding protein [Sphingomonas sp. AP4-R1]QJU58258.1 four-helix bundle copper-binding protein [Sphingomonas sp. AP4-R1]